MKCGPTVQISVSTRQVRTKAPARTHGSRTRNEPPTTTNMHHICASSPDSRQAASIHTVQVPGNEIVRLQGDKHATISQPEFQFNPNYPTFRRRASDCFVFFFFASSTILSSQMTVSGRAKTAQYTTHQETCGKRYRGEQSRKECSQQTTHVCVRARARGSHARWPHSVHRSCIWSHMRAVAALRVRSCHFDLAKVDTNDVEPPPPPPPVLENGGNGLW